MELGHAAESAELNELLRGVKNITPDELKHIESPAVISPYFAKHWTDQATRASLLQQTIRTAQDNLKVINPEDIEDNCFDMDLFNRAHNLSTTE